MKIAKVYGPYSRKQDNRKIVRIKYEDGSIITKSYARYLYEQKNGEIGHSDIVVDHIDENASNDVHENFQLLTRAENNAKSFTGREMSEHVCPICETKFTRYANVVKHNLKQLKAGPFCSKSCAGRYGAAVQNSER